MKFSLEAARMALDANAPEEVLRVVDVALPSAAGPTERVKLLEARDRAFEMLRRPADRLQGLAELSALAEALGDKGLERDLRLRRAASYRMQDESERAAALAREVRELAAADGDARDRARRLHRARAGPAHEPARRGVLPLPSRGRSRRRRRGLRPRRRAGPRARRRREPRRRAP